MTNHTFSTNQLSSVVITAHSGCDNTQPNSEAYLRHAFTAPVDFVEIDIRPYQNQLFLSHDPIIDATPDLVRFESAILFCQENHRRINCDLKQPGLFQQVIAQLKTHHCLEKVVFSGSLERTDWYHPNLSASQFLLNPEVLIPSFYADPCLSNFKKFLTEVKSYQLSHINLNHQVMDYEKVKLAHAMGIRVFVWTVDQPADLQKCLDWGVDGITTNDPALLKSLLSV